jgi:hypothetical protein
MLIPLEQIVPGNLEWQNLCKTLRVNTTLAKVVLTAWQMGLWLARAMVCQQLSERAQLPLQWSCCPQCGTRLLSKGFAKRRILTLVGWVEWRRRVGRCPRHCSGSQSIPFDNVLEIQPYQQTSPELIRLGCLLAVFLPFELAAVMLQQLCGIAVSDDTIWNWVQAVGRQTSA